MIETVFLDAGGVLVNPNWDRVAAALARHGVAVEASALAAAEPYAKKHLDTGAAIQATSDAANFRVYVGLPANADPAANRERLAGVVSLFGVTAASDPNGPTAGNGINQVLEITNIVDDLHLSGDDLNRLDVRFEPANAAVARANFSIRRVSVFKLGD